MKAIKLTVDFREFEKVEPFVSELNTEDDTFAYMVDYTTVVISTDGDLSMEYVKCRIVDAFDSCNTEELK
jgi:hypothetical protein